MERLLLIETSTALCSTALAEDGRIVCKNVAECFPDLPSACVCEVVKD